MSDEKKEVTRRNYAKYAAAGIVVAGVAAAGGYYATLPKAPTTTEIAPTTTEIAPTTTEIKPLKVALMYTTPINDWGWGTASYDAFRSLKETYGDKLETEYSELVPYDQGESVIREYASAGYDLILAYDAWSAAVNSVAPEFPKVYIATSGTLDEKMTSTNAVLFDDMKHHLDYLAGMLGGLLTKSNKVGAIAGEAYPTIVRALNSVILGAREVNTNAKVTSSYTGSWVDPVKAKETALAMIDGGVDHIWEYSDMGGLGVHKACEQRGITSTGGDVDKSPMFPQTIVASRVRSPTAAFKRCVEAVINKTWEEELGGKSLPLGLPTGDSQWVWNPNLKSTIPQAVIDRIEAKKQDIIAKKFEPPSIYTPIT